jgi:hypothetical protein
MRRMSPDMEDIFKKAADDYPLKTNTADWESVSRKIESFEEDTSKRKNNIAISKVKAGLAGVLLLLPLWIAISKYEHNSGFNTVAVSKQQNAFEKKQRGKNSGEIKNNTTYNSIFGSTSSAMPAEKKTTVAPPQLASLIRNNETDLINPIVPQITAINGTVKNIAKENDKWQQVLNSYSNKTISRKKNNKVSAENMSKEKDVSLVVAPKEGTKKRRHLYLGIVGAPELTSIKFQPTKRSVNAGAVIGYNVNDKINIELGAVLARKYYYTNGRYIQPNSMRHDNAEILNAYANSSITELPLTVQYNFKKESDSRMFASAGTVSSIIHRESYRYTFVKNGRQKQSSKNFKKASDDLFSNVQLSMGYEHNILNRAGSIRVEPYIRIPVHGIGASNLPVTSAGINIALTTYLK